MSIASRIITFETGQELWNRVEGPWKDVQVKSVAFPPPWNDVDPLDPTIQEALDRGEGKSSLDLSIFTSPWELLTDLVDPFSTLWKGEISHTQSDEQKDKNESYTAYLRANLASWKRYEKLSGPTQVYLTNQFWLSLPVNAVTVSANEALQGGGGQDQVLHYYAGESLKKETATFADDGQVYYGDLRVRCKAGEAVISHGHNLKQDYIIHLVAPYLDDNDQPQVKLYVKTMKSVLACIDGDKIRSVALAVFGTGFYGFPMILAAVITLRILREWLESEENRAKCDAFYIIPPFDGKEIFEVLWPLVFPN